MSDTMIDSRLESVQRAQKLILTRLIDEFGVDLVADMAHTTVGMMYKYKNINEHRYHIPSANMELLSRAVADAAGDLKIARRFLPDSHHITPQIPGNANGTLREENKRLYEIMHNLNVAFDANNGNDFDVAVANYKTLGCQLESEGKKLDR